jgi:hypothetical protein
MPVILTTMKGAMYGWAPQNEARASQRPLPDDALKTVAHSTEKDDIVAVAAYYS